MVWKISVCLAILFLVGVVILSAYIQTYDFDQLKPDIIAATHDLTGRDLTIQGNIGMKIGFSPTLVIEDVSLQNAAWGTRPRMLHIKKFELQLALLSLLTGTVEIRKVSLSESDIFIEMNQKGLLNLPFAAPGPTTAVSEDSGQIYLPEIFLKDVRILDSRLVFKGARPNAPVVLRIKRCYLKSSGPTNPSSLDIDADYNKLPIMVKGTVGPIDKLIDPDEPWPLEISIQAAASTVEITGEAKDVFNGKGLELNAQITSQDISKPARVAGLNLPFKTSTRATFHISGDITDSIRISNLNLLAGKNNLKGFVLMKLRSGKPYFNVTLTSDKLDFRKLDRENSKSDGPAVSKPGRKLFPAEHFPPGLLRRIGADVGVRVKQCLLPRFALQNLKLNLAFKNGRMTLKPLSADIGSGKLQGRATVREVKRRLVGSAAVDIRNMDAGRMLKELDISDALEGELDVSVDLSGRGRSVAELMANMNGRLSVIMGKGQLNNRLLGVLGGDLRAGIFQMLNLGDRSGELTEINCFVTRFDIVEGLAATRVLVLDTPALKAIGKGTINLKTEELDIALEPIAKKGIGTSDTGKINFSFGNLAKPFKLGGTLAEPALAIDATKAAITIGKAVGGFALFGPFGLAVLLVDGESGKKDLCGTAVAIARQKKAVPKKKATAKPAQKKSGSSGSFMDGLKKMFE